MKKIIFICLAILAFLFIKEPNISLKEHVILQPEDSAVDIIDLHDNEIDNEYTVIDSVEENLESKDRSGVPTSSSGSGLGFLEDLSNREHSWPIIITDNLNNLKISVNNTSNSTYVMTVTEGTPTGPPENDFYRIPPGTFTARLFSLPAEIYYINFTCGTAKMSGTISTRLASTYADLL